jgi:histidinol-phosphate/aromatic aminotransferase/cobyric acid decarboxylase-like protein
LQENFDLVILANPDYYSARYAETQVLRQQLIEWLKPFGWDTVVGVGNFVLCHLPDHGPDAQQLIARCRERGLFLRNAKNISAIFGDRTLRVAVKDAPTNQRMIHILGEVLA